MDKQIAKNEGAFVDLLNQEIKELQESQRQVNLTFGIQECSKCKYKLRCDECVYNEKDIEKLMSEARKETAEKFAAELHERINERRLFSMDMMKNSIGDMAQYWNGKINEQSCTRVDIDEICRYILGETK